MLDKSTDNCLDKSVFIFPSEVAQPQKFLSFSNSLDFWTFATDCLSSATNTMQLQNACVSSALENKQKNK